MLLARKIALCVSDAMSKGKAQGLVNYIAEHISVRYEVISNIESQFAYRGQFIFMNDGDRVVTTDDEWSMFFYHLPRFKIGYNSGEKLAWRNVHIAGGQAQIRHIQGNLFELIPAKTFGELAPGQSKTLEFQSQRWCVARSDMWPNWYVTAPQARPVVLKCTKSEELKFMSSLLRPEQVKRHENDLYQPWNPEERFTKNPPVVPSKQLIVPTPNEFEVKEGKVSFGTDWTILHPVDTFQAEAKLLGGEYDETN